MSGAKFRWQRSHGQEFTSGGAAALPMIARMRTLLCAAAVAACCLVPGCTTYDLRAYAGYQSTKLEGDVALAPTGNTIPAQSVDLEQDLGIADESDSVYLRGELALLSFRATLSAFTYEESGDGTLQAQFGDLTIGTPVSSSIDFGSIKGGLTYDINLGPIRVSPGIAVNYMNFQADVRATNFNAFESLDLDAPVPMLYGQAEANLGPLAATLDVGWIDADIEDVDGTVWDLEAMLRYQIVSKLEVFAGYRLITADIAGDADGQDFSGEFEFSGWMFGGGLRF